ncbi:MAG: 5-formyltetrahydrofolate cyclo-ligase, partial [Siphonobacter sp.]
MMKAEVRNGYKGRRKQLTEEDIRIKSLALGEQLLATGFIRDGMFIHVFLPIRKQREVDNWLVIHRIKESYPHVHIVISRSLPETFELNHYELTSSTQMEENQWGIPEPVDTPERRILDEAIDLVLIPLLAFDKQGYRVGYGMGFYDRFLAKCRLNVLKVGLSFFE